jgi:hypothetical protein
VAVSTACGTATETTLVTASPTLTLTTIGTQLPADAEHAELSVAGMFPGYAPTASVKLFGPFPAIPPATGCTAAKRVQQASVVLDGDGTADTDDVTITAVGYYSWTVAVPAGPGQAALSVTCGSAGGTFLVQRPDLSALTVQSTSTAGSTAPSGATPATSGPQLVIASAGIAVPLVSASLLGTDITVPADPSLAGQLDAGAGVRDTVGTAVIAGRASDTHGASGGLATLASVAAGATIKVVDLAGAKRTFTVDSVQILPRTAALPASLFTQSTSLQLVILSAADPITYGPGGSLVTYRSHVVVVASPSP